MPIRSHARAGLLKGRMTAAAAALFVPLALSDARAETEVDLELVLAIDSSGSVDAQEYALQLGGIAEAFRDRSVIDAIASGPHRRIAVAMVLWADAGAPKDETGWWVIGTSAEAHAFAAFVESRPREIKGGTTGIGAGVAAAIRQFEDNAISGRRRVIDVSGDGVENSDWRVASDFSLKVDDSRAIAEARSIAEARGITINGLAITNEVAELVDWYERNVRTGPGSFVMAAGDYADFARAMRIKLLREIGSGPAVTDLRSPVPDRREFEPHGVPARAMAVN